MSGLKPRQRFDRRILVFHIGSLLILLLLTARLIDLQWIQHEDLALAADQNRIDVVPILPTRGEIVDDDGRGMAINRVLFQVQMIPERVDDPNKVIAALAIMLHWDADTVKRLRRRVAQARPDRPVLLDDKLPWQTVAPLAARLHHFPGVNVLAGTERLYPYGAVTSHLLGYLSLAQPDDIDQGDMPNELVGRSGIERSYQDLLRGDLGFQQEEVDAHGRRVAVLDRSEPHMGQVLKLSIDMDVQQAAWKALGNRTGAVVVMNVHTGKLLALVSKPGYDTNHFITGLEEKEWGAWLHDPHKPLLDRAIQGAYPPASTFKLITALAGLRYHAPLATGTTVCKGVLKLADRNLRCWKHEGHGHIGLHRAIVESCDIFFYELGDQLGMDHLTEEARRWGLGKRTGIDLAGEASGNLAGAKPEAKRQQWYRGETMITAIGQGETDATPLQMARFAAALANGGLLLKPELRADSPPQIQAQVDVDPANLAIVRQAMRDVVADPHGTAHYELANLPWHVAGKTGTAQVISMSQDNQGHEEPVYDHHRDHAWFIGFAPYENPQIAIAVFVEHGGHGGSAAAPVAAAVIRTLTAKEEEKQQQQKQAAPLQAATPVEPHA
jgi:penicillin-binding protein 2